MKFSEMFKRKEISEEEKNKRMRVEFGIYALVFLLVIFLSTSNKNIEPSNDTSTSSITSILSTSTEKMKKTYEKLKSGNYNLKVTREINDEKFYYEASCESLDEELLQMNENFSITNGYYRRENNYYILKDANFIKAEDPLIYKTDLFLDIKNIYKLLDNEYTIVSYEENKINYIITTKTILELYNEYNTTDLKTNNTSSNSVLQLNEDNSVTLTIDMKEVYNIFSSDSPSIAKYIFEFKDIGTVDLSEIRKLIK